MKSFQLENLPFVIFLQSSSGKEAPFSSTIMKLISIVLIASSILGLAQDPCEVSQAHKRLSVHPLPVVQDMTGVIDLSAYRVRGRKGTS